MVEKGDKKALKNSSIIKERRLKDEKLPQRPYFEALETFQSLMDEINLFDKPIQKRLRKIEKHWKKFTSSFCGRRTRHQQPLGKLLLHHPQNTKNN